MTDFTIKFSPSLYRKMAMAIFATLCLILTAYFLRGMERWLLLLATTLSGVWAWCEPSDFVEQIYVDEQGYAQIHTRKNPIFVEAKLCSGSLICPVLCCLKWQCEHGTIWQCVLPDMLSNDDFRRLRVWAEWCQYR